MNRLDWKSIVRSGSCVGTYVAGIQRGHVDRAGGSSFREDPTRPMTTWYLSDVEIVDSLANGK
jgi:hypothetical protein